MPATSRAADTGEKSASDGGAASASQQAADKRVMSLLAELEALALEASPATLLQAAERLRLAATPQGSAASGRLPTQPSTTAQELQQHVPLHHVMRYPEHERASGALDYIHAPHALTHVR